MDNSNEKKLEMILFFIILVIIIIVIASLSSYIFKTDRYGYELPEEVLKKSTTTKIVDNSYIDLLENEKISYNKDLLDSNFLLPLNNSLSGNLSTYNINLIQNDESKFIFAYTKLKLSNKDNISLDTINEVIKNTFNYQISERYINKFYNSVNNNYSYDYSDNYTFCLKAKAKKEEKNYLYIKLDVLDYNEELCNVDRFDYETDKEGIISYKKVDNKYYINSFKIMKKEG